MVDISEDGRHDSDEEIFEVERILGKRKRRGKVEFLVQWRGYNSEDNSWEPQEHLIGCSNAIKEFGKTDRAKKKTERQSRSNGYLKSQDSPKHTRSIPEDLEQYRIVHRLTSPPVSPLQLEKRKPHSEMKPAQEEKAPNVIGVGKVTVAKKKSLLKIMAAVCLFLLLILALVQPVGVRSKIGGS